MGVARASKVRSCPPEAILDGCDRKVVALVNRIRALIQDMIDGVSEVGDPAGRRIRFRRRGDFAFVQPMEDHVRLGFEYGAALPNFGGVLEGDGKRVRHLTIRSSRAVTSMGVKTLLSAALFDDDTHGFRRRAAKR